MINSSRGKDFGAKQEGDTNDNKLSKTTSTSRQWAGFKNPRIVRVSRSSGGKDRHSKVCTIKGLRDRRIRLSVPTAIQLYDLQDRLGLSQPSKVIDWLLDATKDEIDELPPLQMQIGDFSQFHQPTSVPQELNSPQLSYASFLNPNATFNQRMKGKEVEREAIVENKWTTANEQENEGENGGLNFFPLAQSSFPGFPNNPYYNWEPSNLSLSQSGNQGFSSQADSHISHSLSLLPSSLALPSASQFFFPPFPPYMTTLGETDPRQVNHFQFLSPSSQHVLPNSLMPSLHLIDSQERSLMLNVNSKVHSQNNCDSQPNKGKSGSSAQNFLS